MAMMARVFLILCLGTGCLPHAVLSQTLSQQAQLVLLTQANRAFEQALAHRETQEAQGYYQQAITAYEQLIAAGVENAKLYYNLGNAYFLHNDIGRAILQYRHALRLEPGNRRVQANLRYARNQRTDQFDTSVQQALLSRLLFWQDDLRLQTQVTLALGGFLLAWAFAFVRLFRPHAAFAWLTAGAAFVCVLFAASALIVHAQHQTTRHGVVVASETPVRKGNGESYALQFPQPLHSGAEFVVLEERGAWLHIRIENAANGWIRREHAALW